MRGGDILFVPATQREELRRAALRAGVPVVHRVDVWDLILAPFLDTEFDPEDHARFERVLAENDVPAELTADLRREYGKEVFAANVYAWEWCHLGLFDLLHAHNAPITPRGLMRRLLRRGSFERTYWAAIEIALRGRLAPSPARGVDRDSPAH